MIDQSQINLFNYIPGQFKKVGQTGGGELHGPCPFCGGKDRFAVWPSADNGPRWWCRQCNRSGDALAFAMQYFNEDKFAACERLGLKVPDEWLLDRQAWLEQRKAQKKQAPLPPRAPQPEVYASDLKDYACFEDAWQNAAETFVSECAGRLWDNWHDSPAGKYLESRGIRREAAVVAMLGVNDQHYQATWGSVEVYLPRGITVPWEIDQQLWNVRVRRRNADLAVSPELAKYASAKGCANGMYGIDSVRAGQTVYMTEGEFDDLVLRQFLLKKCIDNATVVSIGSSTGARVMRWVTRLGLASKVILAFDNDGAGEAAANWWRMALHPKAGWLKPSKKDITEMWQAGELALWIGEGV